MKFQLVWIGSEDDGGGQPRREDAHADHTPRSGYEQRDGAMFRRERLQNGRLRFTQLSNFTARIVGDILLDDGDLAAIESAPSPWAEGYGAVI